MAEQRYQALLAGISDGLAISQVAGKFGVLRQMVHAWLARNEAEAIEELKDRSHRPDRCPHRSRPHWGPRRLVFELAKRKFAAVPSESAVCRALVPQRFHLPSPPRSDSAVLCDMAFCHLAVFGLVSFGKRAVFSLVLCELLFEVLQVTLHHLSVFGKMAIRNRHRRISSQVAFRPLMRVMPYLWESSSSPG